MNKYWAIPAVAVTAITASMIYMMTNIEKPKVADGKATFVDGTTISEVRFESSDAVDKHRIAVIKLVTGTTKGLSFAVHLNDSTQKIFSNVGDFPLAKYCQGEKVLECSIPISREDFDKSVTLGIAAYTVPSQLIEVKEGKADWDNHRAIFSTLAH